MSKAKELFNRWLERIKENGEAALKKFPVVVGTMFFIGVVIGMSIAWLTK